ncbi:hypothetical protein KC968_02675 [Candidatus Saccharibacteria bacterium]|nr:hypothetical protein [Candidatus Saccharibacteria bacterium]
MSRHLSPFRIRTTKLTNKQRKILIRRSVLAMAIIEPIMTLPQVFEVWIDKEVAGVSGTTWGFYVFASVVWLMYGLQLKDKPLIISSTLWVVTEAAVFIGVVLYS